MQRIAIGLAVGLAAWVGSALRAEAQVIIGPTGPLCINTGATSTTYTATVTNLAQGFTFYLTVSLNGVPQCCPWQYVSHTGTSANVTFVIDFTQWTPSYTAVKGDVIDFYAQVKVGPFLKSKNDYSVTVTDPISWSGSSGSKMLEARDRVTVPLEAVDRDRRDWA